MAEHVDVAVSSVGLIDPDDGQCREDECAIILSRAAMDPERQRRNREQFQRMADRLEFSDKD